MPRYALVITGTIDDDAVEATTAFVRSLLQYGPDGTNRLPAADTLANGRACQWRVDIDEARAAGLLTAARERMADQAIDVNLVPDDEHRRKRLLLADMDSTIIQQECIDEIAAFAGVGERVAAITERAMRGELDFEAALSERVALLRDLPEVTLARVADERLSITPGARELVATMRHHGAYCVLVSGGFTFFTGRIAKAVGFDENRANTLEIAAGRLTGRPVAPILGRQAKHDTLIELSGKLNIPRKDTLAVGDGANDLAMIEAADLGIAFHAKPLVNAAADAQVQHGDLSDLLFLQGYRADEIVTPTCPQS
jgi:phosphoserine phosphatase